MSNPLYYGLFFAGLALVGLILGITVTLMCTHGFKVRKIDGKMKRVCRNSTKRCRCIRRPPSTYEEYIARKSMDYAPKLGSTPKMQRRNIATIFIEDNEVNRTQ